MKKRICDKCGYSEKLNTKLTLFITVKHEMREYDLCSKCKLELKRLEDKVFEEFMLNGGNNYE